MIGRVHIGLVAVVVQDYDPAISFFVGALGFELVEDSPAVTNDGRTKRWVVVRPRGRLLRLARARSWEIVWPRRPVGERPGSDIALRPRHEHRG